MLGLPFKETLNTYPILDPIMKLVEQEDLREKSHGTSVKVQVGGDAGFSLCGG